METHIQLAEDGDPNGESLSTRACVSLEDLETKEDVFLLGPQGVHELPASKVLAGQEGWQLLLTSRV